MAAAAWQRFSWWNLGAHAAFAATWLIGRSMLSGREAGGQARALTRVKDGLVIASIATGITSMVLGRSLGRRVERGIGPERMRDANTHAEAIDGAGKRTRIIQRVVGGSGLLNLLANIGIAAVTAVLAMEGNKSVRFAQRSWRLP